jgi:hypothetical protein
VRQELHTKLHQRKSKGADEHEGTSGLFVRGGSPDQNLILLDGVPVYYANHLFGFFSVFNPDAISSVSIMKGGFPARYGGRLSSVIDVHMKEGNMRVFKDGALLGEMQEDQVNNNGQYFLFETVEAGAECRFEVAHSELEAVQAFTRVPLAPPTFIAELVDTTGFEWTIEVTVEDIPGDQYYIVDFLWSYGQGGSDSSPIWFNSTDPFLNTPYTFYDPTDPNKYFDGEAYFTDEHYSGGSYSFRVKFYADDWTAISSEGVEVRLKHVSEDYYRYKYSSLLQQWTDGDPFAQPAIVHNNVENGIGCVGSLYPGSVLVSQ